MFDYGMHPPIFVAHAAAEALAEIGDTSAVPQLENALAMARSRVSGERYASEAAVANQYFVEAVEKALRRLTPE